MLGLDRIAAGMLGALALLKPAPGEQRRYIGHKPYTALRYQKSRAIDGTPYGKPGAISDHKMAIKLLRRCGR